jgi:alkanesulfonate monooxygenase SsuD/methylene tetrahydromethanopterin reductase-like flavin-dependent oxidoreductase (luciferase family)
LLSDVQKLMDGKRRGLFSPTRMECGLRFGYQTSKLEAEANSKRQDEPEEFGAFLLQAFNECARFRRRMHDLCGVVRAEWATLMTALREAGYHWSSTIYMEKGQPCAARKDYQPYEPIWYGWAGGERAFAR